MEQRLISLAYPFLRCSFFHLLTVLSMIYKNIDKTLSLPGAVKAKNYDKEKINQKSKKMQKYQK